MHIEEISTAPHIIYFKKTIFIKIQLKNNLKKNHDLKKLSTLLEDTINATTTIENYPSKLKLWYF